MISEMETIQILSSKLREEELENERLRRERNAESQRAARAAEDARVARESAEQYHVQLEEERKARGDRIEPMLKEVMMFITGKGTASLSESLSDSIIRKMQEQHVRELAELKAADEERFRKMDEDHRIREAALESRIRELEDARDNEGHDHNTPGNDSHRHFNTVEEAEAAYLNEKRKNDDHNRLRFSQSTESKYAGRNAVDADASDMKGEDAPDSTDVFNKKCLATEEMVGMVLYMHYVEHVTVAQMYKELCKMGVNVSEATLDSWIAIGIDEFKPLMEPTQKEIVASGEAYMDETHLLVKCDIEDEARQTSSIAMVTVEHILLPNTLSVR